MKCYCPILGEYSEVRPLNYSSGEWRLVQCEQTGFVFLPNAPTYDQVATEFAWEKTFCSEKEHRKKSEPVVSYFSNRFKDWRTKAFRHRNKLFSLAQQNTLGKNSLSILDIGPAKGHRLRDFCQLFEEAGVTAIPSGIEISPQLAQESDSVFRPLGGQVITAAAYDGLTSFTNEQFDVVVMSCYLEHEAQPLQVLRRATAVLSDGGVIVIKVPNYNSLNRLWRQGRWCGFRYPDHVNYFTPATLAILAQNAGYSMQPQRFSDRIPTSDNMYAVLKKTRATPHIGNKAA